METLLVLAVVVITLAVVAQAVVLLAMYLLSRRVTGKVEILMADSRRLMAPLESVTGNLKAVSEDLVHTGEIARETVMRPVRQYSAVALAIAEGVRTWFRGPREGRKKSTIHEERPAA